MVHVSCVLSTAFPWSASLGVKSGIYFILWSYIVLSVSESLLNKCVSLVKILV